MRNTNCRSCGMTLTMQNARTSRGRWVGACRSCESIESLKRSRLRRAERPQNVHLRLPAETFLALVEAADARGVSIDRFAEQIVLEALTAQLDQEAPRR